MYELKIQTAVLNTRLFDLLLFGSRNVQGLFFTNIHVLGKFRPCCLQNSKKRIVKLKDKK